MNKRYTISRRFLIFWTIFIGIGAVAGSIGMLVDPSGKAMGMDSMLPYFQVLPFADKLFQNLIFSGIMLLIVNGISNIVACVFLFLKKKIGVVLGMIFGITLMMWIVIQFIIFPLNFMSTIFFIFGFLQFITGVVCLIGLKQSEFRFDDKIYKNIGKDSKKIVVFFSRMGYTKKLAYEIADEKGAEILEIKTTEKIDGNLGFWWCGRFGMHRWGMNFEKTNFNPSKYDEITICSPIWVFSLSSPVRQFCIENAGKIKKVNYVFTHFMSCKFNNIALKLDQLLKVEHNDFHSFRCRFGKLREIK